MASSSASPARHRTLWQTYGERSDHPSNTPLATYLLRLAHIKRTNLCVSADVTTSAELLRLAEDVGDHICVLKTHADIIADFTDKTSRKLSAIARRRKFVIFEDRKFGDIGNTVQLQYTNGPLSIVQWAPIVNAHLFPGPAIITALAQAAQKAITKHNTSVSTSISASPTPSISGRDTESIETEEPDSGSDTSSDGDADEDREEEHVYSNAYDEDKLNGIRGSRKQSVHSVVSMTTTISMKSETMSPPATLRPSLSRGSTGSDSSSSSDGLEDIDPETTSQLLEELGPPPFYRALLLLAEMSTKDNFLNPEYTAACVKHARENSDFVMGFIAQRSLNTLPDDNFITMTPGVQLAAGGDSMGQQYNTPRRVIGECGCDIAIVGRGVLQATDRKAAAAEYRLQAWRAYEERVRTARKARR